jgi:hypothetical protein
MFEQHNTHNPLLSLNQVELHVFSLENQPVWHGEINVFNRDCRYCLRKISEASLVAV